MFSWSSVVKMVGRGKIAETIFNLRNLAVHRSGQDSTEILENEDSEPEQRISPGKKSGWSSAVKITLALVLLSGVVGMVCVELQTRDLIRSYHDRILSLEQTVRSSNATSKQKYKDLQSLEEDLRAIKSGTEDFEEKLESDFENVKQISSSQLNTFIRESNMTLCTLDKHRIHFPVAGTYKLWMTLVVTGHIYAQEQIAQLKLNNDTIVGGVVNVSAEEVADEKNEGKCEEYQQRSKCFRIKHAMLVRAKAGDEITVVKDERNTGVIVKEKICIRFSEIRLPDNVTSTVITH